MLLRSDERTVSGRMAEEMRAFVEALKGPEFAQVIAERRRRGERRSGISGYPQVKSCDGAVSSGGRQRCGDNNEGCVTGSWRP